MPGLTIFFGLSLVVLGAAGYYLTGRASWTAWIPAFFGVGLLALGTLAQRPGWRKHAMHAALVVALLGIAGAARGIPKFFALLSGATVARPAAVIAQVIMAALCLAFLALGISSFIAARRKPATP